MFAQKKAQIIKCFCGGTKSARIPFRGTKCAGKPNPLLHRHKLQRTWQIFWKLKDSNIDYSIS